VAVLNGHEVILPSRLCGPSPGGRARGSLEDGSVTRSVALLAVLLSILLVGGGHSGRAQTTEEEYRIKAAFIFHFAQLVDWPTGTATDTDNSLFLCTLGEDPFQGMLEATVAGKAIGSRMIRIRHLGQAQDAQACQILFIGRAQSKRIPQLVAGLRNAPILTVGETAGFLDAGGMIRFLLEENKVRFEINVQAAESAHLKIGSRLLILAEHVVGEDRGK
jgi:YfiR/HmsC-like